jgi:hypothetical protein
LPLERLRLLDSRHQCRLFGGHWCRLGRLDNGGMVRLA